MKLFYEYEAESPKHGVEHWVRIVEESIGETNMDYISPINKIPATYGAKLYPSNYPIIEIVNGSRGRELKEVNYNHRDEYFIIFSNREQNKKIISIESFSWEECIKIGEKYRNVTFEILEKILAKNDRFYFRKYNKSK